MTDIKPLSAAQTISFLVSVIDSGERLTAEDRAGIRATLDAARTASVAGLEQREAARLLHRAQIGCIEGCDPDGDVFTLWHDDNASRLRAALNSAPSIEQEPGEHRLLFPPHPDGFHVSSALCSCGDWQYDHDTAESLLAAQQDVRRDHVAHIRAALREQEPGETLRAAAERIRTYMDDAGDLGWTFDGIARAALEARARVVVDQAAETITITPGPLDIPQPSWATQDTPDGGHDER